MAVVVCFLFYVSSYKNIFRRTLDTRASFLFLKAAKSFLKGNLSTLKKKRNHISDVFYKGVANICHLMIAGLPYGQERKSLKTTFAFLLKQSCL